MLSFFSVPWVVLFFMYLFSVVDVEAHTAHGLMATLIRTVVVGVRCVLSAECALPFYGSSPVSTPSRAVLIP